MQSTDRQTQKWPGANRQTADRQTPGRQTPDRPGTDRRTTGRYSLVDGIRGLAVVNMIAFHFLFDWIEIFHGDYSWYWMTPVRIWQQFICWTFILVSGFVWTWGKQKNLQRGLFLNFCGCMISIVMLLFLPEQAIWFGILNFYGCAVLLTIPLEKLLRRIPPEAGLAAAFVLFGKAPDGMNASGHSDWENFYNYVEVWQKRWYDNLRWFYKILTACVTGKDDVDFELSFNKASLLSPQQKVANDTAVLQNVQMMRDLGMPESTINRYLIENDLLTEDEAEEFSQTLEEMEQLEDQVEEAEDI